MTIDPSKFPLFFEQIANDIDIPPSKYQDAVSRYEAVGRWLDGGDYAGCEGQLSIYSQGSFRLGTVVRPIRQGVEGSYDIDLVCEIPLAKNRTTPRTVKHMVGNRLRQNEIYRRLLDPEGRRCWTLEYAEDDGVGFHLDVLPAVPDTREWQSTAVAITHKSNGAYAWSASDPRGYGTWFDDKNAQAFARVVVEQKRLIQRRASPVYASIDEVPDQLVRTPLQRSIQLMKRNRDLHFNRPETIEYAPISIIITTLAAQLYAGETDAYSALTNIVGRLHEHAGLVEGREIDPALKTMKLIRRLPDGSWYVANPVNPAENFADRWHENGHARARAFFSWLDALQRDLLAIGNNTNPRLVKVHCGQMLGVAAVAKHVDILVPSAGAVEPPPRIHISRPAKPWRSM